MAKRSAGNAETATLPELDKAIQDAHRNLEDAEANIAEFDVLLRARARLAARVREAAQNAAGTTGTFRAACESLISKEKKLASESAISGIEFRPVFAPYYRRSIDKANEAENRAKIL